MLLLDSDVMIDIIRGHARALTWLEAVEHEKVSLPGYVAMELYQGCRNKSEQVQGEAFLEDVEIVWPSADACNQALDLYIRYHLSHNLSIFDALIGQTALSLGLPLFSFNEKHYAAIPELETIQPYKK